jgi:hypothetical protein
VLTFTIDETTFIQRKAGMKKAILLSAVSIVFLIGITGCKPQLGLGSITVSGTVSAPYWSLSTDPWVTAVGGGQSFTAFAQLVGSLGSENFTYSIPWIPAGTYSVKIYLVANYYGTGATYSVDDGTPTPVTAEDATTGPPYTVTIEIDDVVINADTRIDLQLPSVG